MEIPGSCFHVQGMLLLQALQLGRMLCGRIFKRAPMLLLRLLMRGQPFLKLDCVLALQRPELGLVPLRERCSIPFAPTQVKRC